MLQDWVLCGCVVCVWVLTGTHVWVCMRMCALVCACVHAHVCTWRPEAKRQSCLPCFFETASLQTRFLQKSRFALSPSCSPVLELQHRPPHSAFSPSTWVLGVELRFSCLQDKHLTDWAISLACLWFLNHFCKLGDFYVCGEGLTTDLCFHTVAVALRAKGGCSWILREYGTSGTMGAFLPSKWMLGNIESVCF